MSQDKKTSIPFPIIRSPSRLNKDEDEELKPKPNDKPIHHFNLYDPFNTVREDAEQKLHEFNLAIQEAFHTKSLFEKIRQSQDKLRLFLDDPSSSLSSLIFNIILSILIFASTILMILESVRYLYLSSPSFWFYTDLTVTSIFTVEILLRIWASSSSWKNLYNYILSFLFLVDMVAILPFYVELLLMKEDYNHVTRLTGLRTVRVFQLLKMFKFINQVAYIQISFEIAGESVRRSLGPLFPLFGAGAVIVLFLSTLIFYAERGTFDPVQQVWKNSKNETSPFSDIPETIWFVLTTITTTGYGDMAPETFWGRFFTFVAMICGMLLIALPSIIIGRNFSILWGNLKAKNQVPPPPVWLQKLTGSGSKSSGSSSQYQKLQHDDDEDNRKSKASKLDINFQEIEHPGKDSSENINVIQEQSTMELHEMKPSPEKHKDGLFCPKCKHRFHSRNFRTSISHASPVHKTASTFETVSEGNTMLLDSEVTDMELLRQILIEVKKGTKLLADLVDQNSIDDEIMFAQSKEDDDQ